MKKNIIILFCIITVLFSINSIKANTNESTQMPIIYPEEGIYTISNLETTDMVFEVSNNSLISGANIQLGNTTNQTNQQFLIQEKYCGWYFIQNLNSQCNLDVANADPNPNTNLQQCTPNNSEAQLFRFIDAGNNELYIQSKLGTYITLSDTKIESSANIYLSTFQNITEQKWTLNLIESLHDYIDFTDGNYNIYTIDQDVFFMSIDEPSKLIGQSICYNNSAKSSATTFTIQKEWDGWYTIKNTSSNLYLDVYKVEETFYLRQWAGTGGNNQKFKFIDSGNDTVIIISKYQLAIDRLPQNTQPNIYLTSYSNTNTQQWVIQAIN